ncbi:MAG: hypothetical protein V3S55_15285 [Nitrospiraceae bacterium]
MSKVYVVQRPAYYDKVKRGWVNKYDLSPAKEYGELVFLLRPGNIYKDELAGAVVQLLEVLKDFTTEDHLLAVGDPVAIAATVLVAGRMTGGSVSLLKWDRIAGSYQPYVVSLPK